MRKKLTYLVLMLASFVALAACSKKSQDADSDKINVVASYSIIGDMVKNVGGDKVSVNNIVPVGVDPHSYEPTPEDSKKMDKADLVFYNGFNLETAKGWFEKMLVNSRKEDHAYELTKGVTPLYLTEDSSEKTEDPHAWLNIQNGIKYVENIKDQLVSYDAKNKDVYEKNAASYIAKLQRLDEEGAKKLLEIPEERRVLVTSEGAFKYFAKRYAMDAEYIWEINTDNQGTPEQMVRIDDIVKERDVPALFVETSVSPKTMEAVARNTGRKIASKLFTDSLAKEGEEGDSYYQMMEWNINNIYQGLK